MSDLVAFLRARLDEDERSIRTMQAVGERFRDNHATEANFCRDTPLIADVMNAMLDDPAVAEILSLASSGKFTPPNDLERVLREVEAKRKILAMSQQEVVDGREVDYDVREALEEAVRALAAVYSSHPDYPEADDGNG